MSDDNPSWLAPLDAFVDFAKAADSVGLAPPVTAQLRSLTWAADGWSRPMAAQDTPQQDFSSSDSNAAAKQPAPATRPIADLLRAPLHDERPTLVSGIAALPQRWTVADIRERVGATVVPITDIAAGAYMGAKQRNLSVADYLDEIDQPPKHDAPAASMPYLAELSYDEHFPELAKELVDPPAINGERFLGRVMYLGRSVHSQTHFHTAGSAMLFCLAGEKIVRLYHPDQTPFLHKAPGRNFSEVLISSLGENTYVHDESAYPDFAQAEYVEFRVRPGDVLYIPIYWWHSIQNVDEISLTAVYFWREVWRDGLRRLAPPYLPPKAMRRDYVVQTINEMAIDRVRNKLGR